ELALHLLALLALKHPASRQVNPGAFQRQGSALTAPRWTLMIASHCRCAASAFFARSRMKVKNACDWPMKRPLAIRPSTATVAPKTAEEVETGRMTEHLGSFRLRKGQGSGMIRLLRKSSPTLGWVRSGKVSPFVGSVSGGAFPALSCQVWKCIVSL